MAHDPPVFKPGSTTPRFLARLTPLTFDAMHLEFEQGGHAWMGNSTGNVENGGLGATFQDIDDDNNEGNYL